MMIQAKSLLKKEGETKMKKLLITLMVVIAILAVVGVAAAQPKNFVAPLSGAEEVPPRVTPATGQADFVVRTNLSAFRFQLTVNNIMNVVAAHIHCGPPGVNGPIGVTLYMAAPGGGPISGVIAQGTITAPDTGNACGWMTVADVVTAMRTGNAYVNVHTNDGVPPTNTGPGDFPGGEIRGQIRPAG
jgi:hypothetical protein